MDGSVWGEMTPLRAEKGTREELVSHPSEGQAEEKLRLLIPKSEWGHGLEAGQESQVNLPNTTISISTITTTITTFTITPQTPGPEGRQSPEL